jgi:hypothetical protein
LPLTLLTEKCAMFVLRGTFNRRIAAFVMQSIWTFVAANKFAFFTAGKADVGVIIRRLIRGQ